MDKKDTERTRHRRPIPVSTGLALARTVLASDRTLLAWVRTSLSLMTFGFTLYKAFDALHKSGAINGNWDPAGARHFGLVLITFATVMMAWQTISHYRTISRFSKAIGRRIPITSTLVAGGAVALFGMVALVDILLETGLF